MYLGINSRISFNEGIVKKQPLLTSYSQVDSQIIDYTDEYIYFYDDEDNNFYKVKMDGSEFQLLLSTFDEVNAMTIIDNYLYVTTTHGKQLHRVSFEDMSNERLADEGRVGNPILVDGDNLYCNYYESTVVFDNSCSFALVDLNGSLKEVIVDEELQKIGSTNSWIYYQVTGDDSIYRYNKERKQIEEVSLETAKSNIYKEEQKELCIRKLYVFGDIEKVKLDDKKMSIKGQLYEVIDGNKVLLEGDNFDFEIHDEVKYNGEGKYSWLWNSLEEDIQDDGKPSAFLFQIHVMNGRIVKIESAG